MRWKRYPAYKDSGVEWLEEVPEHWTFRPIRFSAVINPNRQHLDGLPEETSVSFLPMAAIHEYGGHDEPVIRQLGEMDGYTPFCEGDVLIAKITPCFENGKGTIATGLKNGIGFGTTELVVLRPCEMIVQRYLFYVTISLPFRSLGEASMTGAAGQKRIANDYVRDFPVFWPSMPEQESIVSFLDHETTRIDNVVSKRKRQMELLEEKRTALITHAVTKGLDPNVKMKDSGVEWLEEVPEHWQVCKLKQVTSKIGSGRTPRGGSTVYVASGIMLLRSQNIHFGGLKLEDVVYITEEMNADMMDTEVFPYDTLLNITGASLGRCTMVPPSIGRANVNQHVCIIRPLEQKCNPCFLAFACSARVIQYQVFASEEGTSREGISFEKIKRFEIPLPPLEQQAEIASYLYEETTRIDALKDKIQHSIELLQEYRSALICAAVTGQIDVREEVI